MYTVSFSYEQNAYTYVIDDKTKEIKSVESTPVSGTPVTEGTTDEHIQTAINESLADAKAFEGADNINAKVTSEEGCEVIVVTFDFSGVNYEYHYNSPNKTLTKVAP